MEWVLPISYFASGRDKQLFLFSLILWPSYPRITSPLIGGARADIRCRMAKSLREQGTPSWWVSPLMCNIFPIIEKILRVCFQLCACCQSMVNSQPILLNLSPNIWHSCLLCLLWHTSSFGLWKTPVSS